MARGFPHRGQWGRSKQPILNAMERFGSSCQVLARR